MRNLKFYTAMVLGTIASFGYSQNEVDALRYSQTFFGGSARYTGMAGSFGALGADLSVTSSNPAGLGRFSQNQAALSLGYLNTNSNSTFSGTATNSNRSTLKADNLGIVLASNRESKGKGWRYTQFAFTYNRLADFTSHRNYEGENYNSLLEVFAAQGAGISSEYIFDYMPFTTALAWDTYAIDDSIDMSGNTYYKARLTEGNMYHKRNISTRGGISEYSIAFSGNYLNKLYVGGSINFQNTRYFESFTHTEDLLEPEGSTLRSFTYNWEHSSRGTGVNLKLGAIYAPIEDLRIGLAFHTPTVMRFSETFRAGMNATHETEYWEIPKDAEPRGEFSYKFSNPLRLIASVGYVFVKRLAINVDAELSSYGLGKYKNSSDPLMHTTWVNENQMIRNVYRTTVNWRAGAEFAITSQLFVRGGFAYYPSAFDKSINNQGGNHYFYCGGLGYRWKRLYLDAGYRYHQTTMDYYAYNSHDINNLTVINENKHHLVFTVGFRF